MISGILKKKTAIMPGASKAFRTPAKMDDESLAESEAKNDQETRNESDKDALTSVDILLSPEQKQKSKSKSHQYI